MIALKAPQGGAQPSRGERFIAGPRRGRADGLERFEEIDAAAIVHFADFLLHHSGQLRHRDQPMALTAREFDLLLHFARHPGHVFSRAQLLDSVWGYGHDGYEHTVNSHINRLRAKIEPDPAQPEYIVTVWGVGYKLDARPQVTTA